MARPQDGAGIVYTRRATKSFSISLAVLLLVLGGPSVASGQEPDPEAENDSMAIPGGFEREYLDGSAYRSEPITLYDWPALARLVHWSSRIESALADQDATLSAELLVDFRARVDSLAASAVPDFLASRADSVRAAMGAIDSLLVRAETSLAALPPAPTPTGGEALNAPDERRTLVTGSTAVSVPAGVRVGEADSLPTAELPADEPNFMDLVSLAMTELDRLVHLTRAADPPDPND